MATLGELRAQRDAGQITDEQYYAAAEKLASDRKAMRDADKSGRGVVKAARGFVRERGKEVGEETARGELADFKLQRGPVEGLEREGPGADRAHAQGSA